MLEETRVTLQNLLIFQADWNGYNTLSPNSAAVSRAEDWIVSHPSEALSIAVDWLQKEAPSVELSFNRIIFDYAVNRTGIERYLRFLISEGLVEMESGQVDNYLNGFINTTFIETSP